MLSAEELQAIRERAKAAMPGPWRAYLGPNSELWVVDQPLRPGIVSSNFGPDENTYAQPNAKFVAHAREDIPALLAHAEAQAEQIKELQEALQDEVDQCSRCGGSGRYAGHVCAGCARSRAALAGEGA